MLTKRPAAAGSEASGITLASTPPGVPLHIAGGAPPDKGANVAFRRGVAQLGDRGLTYDSWHYHVQNRSFLDLARATPGTTMVLDHFGTPLGVGPFEGRRKEVFEQWKRDIVDLAGCPNVVAKLGGLAMPDNGFGWHRQPSDRPDVATFIQGPGTLVPPHDRLLRARPLHVRVQLPGRQVLG